MLQGMNRLGQSWVGRIVVAIMFGFLILSFGIWGVGDIFRGGGSTTVATLGRTGISAEAYRTAYQSEMGRLIQRFRRNITPDQARALGIDQRVLGRLVTEAAFDQRAGDLGLAVSDGLVVHTIQADPAFRGPSGAFDRAQFSDLLRQNGISEAQYVRDQRSVVARMQLAEAINGALPVPLALREAVHRYQTETRSVEYLTLGPQVLGDRAAPTDAQIQTFFDGRKATYRAPEYRAVDALAVDPAGIAKPDAVSDADIRKAYEDAKGTRFGTPERRTVEQIVFPSRDEAEAAAARIKDGTTFDAVATERGIDPKTLELGTFAKADMIDRATADIAFALADGAVSAPIEGRFGTVLVRVSKIEPGSQRPFDEVAAELRQDLALARARDAITAVHDAIEDDRASSKPLADIARERGLKLVQVAEMDRQGLGPTGQPVAGLPDATAVAAAAFQSDVGADTEALRTPAGGYVWFEVRKVEPAHDRALAEVNDKVAADWRTDEVSRGLSDKARGLTERLDKGEQLPALAAELGLTIQTASDLARTATSGDLTAAVVPRIFAVPVGRSAAVATTDDKRVLFRVTAARVPPYLTTTQQAAEEETQLRTLVGEDLLAAYVADVQKSLGLTVNPEMMRRAIGGGES